MKHAIYRLNQTGHSPVAEWDPSNKVEIKSAAEVFGKLQKAGHKFFDLAESQQDKTELKVFDPEAKEVIAFGPLVGG